MDVHESVVQMRAVTGLQMMLDLGKDRDWFNSSFIVALALIACALLLR